MSDLEEIYQQVILDHNRSPQNFRELPDANRKAEGFNPLCGDQITVYAQVEDGVIREVSFQGTGCAISKASASLMTGGVAGKTEAEAGALFARMHCLMTGVSGSSSETAKLGKLAVFSGVREFPARVKCATLAWHTLRAALSQQADPVTTE